MRTDLAFSNISHNLSKTAISVAGIGIAILLVFMQLGFRGAVEDTATNIYDKLDFDLLVRSPDYLNFVDANQIPIQYVQEIASIDGIQTIKYLQVSVVNWRNPQGELKGILLLGVSPNRSPFQGTQINAMFPSLTSSNAILIDRNSHPEFGPIDLKSFSNDDIGRQFEVSSQQMTITGLFTLGAGLAANGSAIVSWEAFEKLVPSHNHQHVSFGLVKIQPKANSRSIMDAIHSKFQLSPEERCVEILQRDEAIKQELNRWISETPIGFIFTLGVAVALLVGAAIIYMVLSNDVSNRLNEYATLRAMGYSSLYMSTVIIMQSIYLALFAYVPALILAFLLYGLTSYLTNLPIVMNTNRIFVVFSLTLVMSIFSALFALKKLWNADPAELF